jgi:hypothetical protein
MVKQGDAEPELLCEHPHGQAEDGHGRLELAALIPTQMLAGAVPALGTDASTTRSPAASPH